MRAVNAWVLVLILAPMPPAPVDAQDSCIPWVIESCDGLPQEYECIQASSTLSTLEGGQFVRIEQEYCFKVHSPLFSGIVVEADLGELDPGGLDEDEVIGEMEFDVLLSAFGEDCDAGDQARLWAPVRVVDTADDEALLQVVIEEASPPLVDCLLEYDPTDEFHNFGKILEGSLKAVEGGGFELSLALAPLEGFAAFPGLSDGDLQNIASPVPLHFRPILAEELLRLPETGGTLTLTTTLSARNENLETRTQVFVEVFEISGEPGTRGFIRGDGNADGKIDLSDAVSTLNFLFLGGPGPECFQAADADDNGTVELTDSIRTLNFLFLGGPSPAAPHPECGPDTTADVLTCESFPPCQ